MAVASRQLPSLVPPRQLIISLAALVGIGCAEVLIGLMLPLGGGALAIMLAVLVVAPAAFMLKAEHVVVLSLLALFVSRLVVFVGFPSMIAFVHFPLAIIALIKLMQLPSDRSNRQLLTCLFLSLALTVFSGVVTTWEAFRPLLAWITLTEPFIFFGLVAAMPDRSKLDLRKLLLGIAIAQLPFAFLQFAAYGVGDHVQGTLMGQGAGHHIMGAICAASGWLILWANGKRTAAWVVLAVVLLVVGILADAKQVYGALIGGMVVVGVIQFRRVGPSLIAPAVVMIGVVFVSAHFYAPMGRVVDTSLGEKLFGNKVDQIVEVSDAMGLGRSLTGLGPGNGLSRTALSSVPGYGSVPALIIGDDPAPIADNALANYDAGNVSSAASPFSSWLGIYSDLGILGIVSYLVLVGLVVYQLRGASDEHRRVSYTLLAFAAVLGYVFTWLEEPAFTVFIAVLIATGIPQPTPGRTRDVDGVDASVESDSLLDSPPSFLLSSAGDKRNAGRSWR
jgi:hypothetical protein